MQTESESAKCNVKMERKQKAVRIQYSEILYRNTLRISALQPGHMGDRCSPHARDAQ